MTIYLKTPMENRHQFRADWHDYNGGIYFVTICCAEKRHYFGEITFDETIGMRFCASALGFIVEESIQAIPSYYSDVDILNYVVMPNHIHLIIAVGTRFFASANERSSASNLGCLRQRSHEAPEAQDFHHNSRLASIVGAFKAGVTRQARTRKIASLPANGRIWQPRYYEHIIRDQRAFENITNYINSNVENWYRDQLNHNATSLLPGTGDGLGGRL